MKYEDYSAETRKKIDAYAASRGFTREEVVKDFERIFHGRKVSRHSRRVFACV